MEQDIGVVINGILFKDEDCKFYRKDEPFEFGKSLEPCPRKIKERLIAQGHTVYKWPSEKDKIKLICSLPIQNFK